MSEKNLFEVAVREHFRFPFKGQATVEDLWDLDVRSLDTVFKALNKQLKQVEEESLLDVKTKEDRQLDDMIEIVKYIVSVKQQEQSDKLADKARKEQKQKILEIMESKQEDNLKGKSLEELQAMYSNL